MNVSFIAIEKPEDTHLEVYDSLNRIPFTIKISNNFTSSQSIYTRNINDKNFIEFTFDKNTSFLKEIALISFSEKDIIKKLSSFQYKKDTIFFRCFINNEDDIQSSNKFVIERGTNYLLIDWSESLHELEYFCLNSDLRLGVTHDHKLVSLQLTNLNESILMNILGY